MASGREAEQGQFDQGGVACSTAAAAETGSDGESGVRCEYFGFGEDACDAAFWIAKVGDGVYGGDGK